MIRTILHYPDKRLKEKGLPIEKVTPEIQRLIDDMAETMYAAPGVGLAATQIGEKLQLFIIDIAEEGAPSELRVFINPEILASSDEMSVYEEGCLSIPEYYEEVERPAGAPGPGPRNGRARESSSGRCRPSRRAGAGARPGRW